MTYDLRLGATVTGANDVKLLADSVALLANKLPTLAAALEGFKGFGDIKGINQGIKALAALQTTVQGVDTAKIRETARDIDKLAASLAKLDGKTLPKGFVSPAGGAQGFKAASDLKAMAQTMADSNQSVATALAQLSTTIKGGYERAARETDASSKKVLTAEEQSAKEGKAKRAAARAALQADYDKTLEIGAKYQFQELKRLKAAGVQLHSLHSEMIGGLGMSQLDKDRADQKMTGRLKSANPAEPVDYSSSMAAAGIASDAADKVFKASTLRAERLAKLAQSNDAVQANYAKARLSMLKASDEAYARAADSLAAKDEADGLRRYKGEQQAAKAIQDAKDADTQREINNQKLRDEARLVAARQARKVREDTEKLSQASLTKNAAYKVATPDKQLQSQILAASKLEMGVSATQVVREHGSIAALAAKRQGLSALQAEQEARTLGLLGQQASAVNQIVDAEKASASAAQTRAISVKQEIADTQRSIAAKKELLGGKNLTQVAAKYGTSSAELADASTLEGLLTRQYQLMAERKALSTKQVASEQETLDILQRQARVMDQIAAAQKAGAIATGQESATRKADLAEANRNLAAKKALLQGKDTNSVAAEFGNSAVSVANATSLKDLTAAQYEAASKKGAVEAATLATLRQQAATIDQIAAAEKLAAKDIGTKAAIRKAELADIQRILAAKKALMDGDKEVNVASKYGNTATSAASGASLESLVNRHYQLSSAATTVNPKLVTMAKNMDMLHSAARGAASGFGAMWLTWGQVAPLLAGAALSHSFVQTVKMGAEFGHQLEVIRNLSGATSTQINGLRGELLALSQGAVGPLKVAEAAKTLSLAGLNVGQVKTALQDVLNLSVAGTTDINTAAEVMVAVSTAFGYSADQYGRVGDIIAKTAAVSIADITDMSAAFKYSTTVAEQYGVGLEDVATSLASLAQRGIKGSSAGVAARQMFQELTGATAKTAKMLKELGIEAFDGATGKLKPLLQLMNELEVSMTKLNKTEVSEKLRDLFNERASKAVVGLKADYDLSLKELNAYANGVTEANKKIILSNADLSKRGKPLQELGGGLTSADGSKTNMTGREKMQELVSLQAKGDIDAYTQELKKLSDAAIITDKSLLGVQNAAYNTSAGFSALASAGMAMSAQNQMEAVKNTLQTSLISAFTEIEPVVSTVAHRLQQLFASSNFKQGIVDLATAMANFTSAVANNIGAVVTLTKIWLTFKVTALAGSMFTAASAGLANLSVTLSAASTASMSTAASMTAAGIAANGLATASPRAAAGMSLMAAGAARLNAALGIIGVVATAAYAAWTMFYRDGLANVTANQAANEQADSYIDKLKQQIKHFDDLNAARQKGVSLEEQLANAEKNKFIAGVVSAGVAEGEGILKKLATVHSEMVEYGVTSEERDKLKTANKPSDYQAGGASFVKKRALVMQEAALQQQLVENRMRQTSKVAEIEENVNEVMRKGAVDRKARDQEAADARNASDQKQTYSSAKEQEKQQKAAEATARALAKVEMDSYLLKLKDYKDTTAAIEAEAKRLEEVQLATAKAGQQSQAVADAKIAANKVTSAQQMADAYTNFKNSAISDLEAVEAILAKPGKPADVTAVEQAQLRLKEMRQEALTLDQKQRHASTLGGLKPIAADNKVTSDLDKFIEAQAKSLSLGAQESALRLTELGLTKEQISLNKSLLKHQSDYAEQYGILDKAIATVEADIGKVTAEANATRVAMASLSNADISNGSAGKLADDLAESGAVVAQLSTGLANLGKSRSKLKLSEVEQRELILNGDIQEGVIESLKVKLDQLRNRRDALATGFDNAAKSVWDSALSGEGNVINRFANGIGKALRQSVGDALYDALFKDALKDAGTGLAKKLFGSISLKEDTGSGTNLFAGAANKALGIGKDESALSNAWTDMQDSFKQIDWDGMWSGVTKAFTDIDWGGIWKAVQNFMKPADAGGTDLLGTLKTIGAAFSGGDGGLEQLGDAGGYKNKVGHAFSGAQMFANGSAFANSIIDTPTYFKYGLGGSSLGQMGEAGPEAVMPLARTGNGKLGVATVGGGGKVSRTEIHTHNHVYNIGSGVTRADLAKFGSQVVAAATGEVANGVKRNDGRFSKS